MIDGRMRPEANRHHSAVNHSFDLGTAYVPRPTRPHCPRDGKISSKAVLARRLMANGWMKMEREHELAPSSLALCLSCSFVPSKSAGFRLNQARSPALSACRLLSNFFEHFLARLSKPLGDPKGSQGRPAGTRPGSSVAGA